MTTPHRGARYDFVHTSREGIVLDRFHAHNLVPTEGLNYALGVVLKQLSQPPAWFLYPWANDYTPDMDVKASTLPGLGGEFTQYTPSARPTLVPGAITGGSTSNGASLAAFTFTAAATLQGMAIVSASAKGSTSGILLSAVRFPSPKVYGVGDRMDVFVGASQISA